MGGLFWRMSWLVATLVAAGAIVVSVVAVLRTSQEPAELLGQTVPLGLDLLLSSGLTLGVILVAVALLALATSLRQYRLRSLAWRPGPISFNVEGIAADDAVGDDVAQIIRDYLRANRLDPARARSNGSDENESIVTRLRSNRSRLLAPVVGLAELFVPPSSAYDVSVRGANGDNGDGATGANGRVGLVVTVSAQPGPHVRRGPVDRRDVGGSGQRSRLTSSAVGSCPAPGSGTKSRGGRGTPQRSTGRSPFISGAAPSPRAGVSTRPSAALYASIGAAPHNVALRVELASLLERLGLYMDSLLMLRAALDYLESRAPSPSKRATGTARFSRRAALTRVRYTLAARKQDLLSARFHYAVTLGVVEKTSAQWQETRPVGPERERQREETRRALRQRFVEEYRSAFAAHYPDYDLEELLILTSSNEQPQLDSSDDRVRAVAALSTAERRGVLDHFFLIASAYELRRLGHDAGVVTRRLARTDVGHRSIRLRQLWLEVRRRRLLADSAHREASVLAGPVRLSTDQSRLGHVTRTAEFEHHALRERVERRSRFGLRTPLAKSWRADYGPYATNLGRRGLMLATR